MEEKHQPCDFVYPKRQFGKTKIVSRFFQSNWYKSWPWLHYLESDDSMLCYTCYSADQQNKFPPTVAKKMDRAFVSVGFSNWKDATVSFRKHETTECHRVSCEVMITLPTQVEDIGEQLCTMKTQEKADNRKMLLKILENVRFLARQGLAFRGSGDDENSNFLQLLKLRSSDDPSVNTWINKKLHKFISPQAQNELIQIMALHILRSIMSDIQSAQFFTMMVDETSDISNKEQVVIILRWVAEDLQVCEDFIGLYVVDVIKASTLVEVVKDTLCLMNLSINKVRGQCYDGASAISGCRSGLAKLIRDEEPRAIYTHCYGHALNLAASNAVKSNDLMKNALQVTHEVTKLLKYSSRRDALFCNIKKELAPDTIGIRVLCPTRWTLRAEALSSIIANYEVLMAVWDEAKHMVRDTETIGRINGVSAYMEKFSFLFGVVLGQLVLGHSDNLSRSLQVKTLTAAEGQKQATLTVTSYNS